MKEEKTSEPLGNTISQEPEPEEASDRTSVGNVPLSKRQFLIGAGVSGAALALGNVGGATPAEAGFVGNSGNGLWVTDLRKRRRVAYRIRQQAALKEKKRPILHHRNNGDEKRYWGDFYGNFSKTLPHDDAGRVDPDAYKALLRALKSGRFEDFENLPGNGNLANPMGAKAFSIEGPDVAAIAVDPPPAIASPQFAAQMAELYWMALLRDVPFSEYNINSDAQDAYAELTGMAGYEGPSDGDAVSDLFRADYPDARKGPMVSQFLLANFAYDGISIDPMIDEPAPTDFMTIWDDWLAAQNGTAFGFGIPTTDNKVYPHTARHLGRVAGADAINSVFFRAGALVLGFFGPSDSANPYAASGRQFPFATFGFGHLAELIGKVHKSERHAWYNKWCVNRFLRPEAGGGRVQAVLDGKLPPELLHDDILSSHAVALTHERFHSYLLPQMFTTGGPTHPSFTAGHAISAGACVTALKAWFDTNIPWSQSGGFAPRQAFDVDPVSGERVPIDADALGLTLGGELNKLAHNLSWGRDMSGVHWRADNVEGNKQGEELTIRLLAEEKAIYPETFDGFSLTKFDGTTITI